MRNKLLVISTFVVILAFFSMVTLSNLSGNTSPNNPARPNEKQNNTDAIHSKNEDTTNVDKVNLEKEPEMETKIMQTQLSNDREPLTGLHSANAPSHRNIMAVISGNPQSMPQSGLSDADVVYEMSYSPQKSSLVAIYHTNLPDSMGPLGGVEADHVDLGWSYDAIMVYKDGDTNAIKRLNTNRHAHLNATEYSSSSSFEQSRSNGNFYANSENIYALSKQNGFRTKFRQPEYKFSEDAWSSNQNKVRTLKILHFDSYQAYYEYDNLDNTFSRFTNKYPDYDFNNGEQLKASNILIIGADLINNKFNLLSQGTGYLVSRGKVIKVSWRTNSIEDIIRVYDDQGQEVELLPGKTWIHVLPSKASIDGLIKFNESI